ncbi:MAG: hypothetical protein H6839_17490 [Planctomycetes bacterium]|nr:hypothetical protein [Planctomycetota bacterium]
MRKEFQPYTKWIGEWTGEGETLNGVPIRMRMVVRPRAAEQMLDFEIQNQHMETGKLVHAVLGFMAVDPDGQRRMVVASTVHGCMLMEMTPEDPGAGAIEGVSVMGHRVVVSLVEDDGGLMLTSYWMKDTPEAEKIGFTNVKLTRVEHA